LEQEGFAVIACGETRLNDFIHDPFPTPATDAERAVILACRELLKSGGREHGRLEISPGTYAYFGAKSSLLESAGRSARDP
jgi:hypothetical protein